MGSSEAENGDPTYSCIENISSSDTKKFPKQSLHLYQSDEVKKWWGFVRWETPYISKFRVLLGNTK